MYFKNSANDYYSKMVARYNKLRHNKLIKKQKKGNKKHHNSLEEIGSSFDGTADWRLRT